MIGNIPLLAAACITQPVPNSWRQEYQIAGDTETISIILLKTDVVGEDMPWGAKCRSGKGL